VFAIGAIVASSAFAAAEWLQNNAAIGAPVAVTSVNDTAVQLEDTGGGLVAPTEVECPAGKGDNKGTVGPGALDELTEAICLEPLRTVGKEGACTAEPTALEAVGLPWTSELELNAAGELRVHVTNAAKKIGWLVLCLTMLGVEVDDECTNELITFLAENVALGEVLLEADALTEEESLLFNSLCTQGGKEGVLLRGADILVLGAGISIEP
jgi:hypothetical protein